MTPYHLAARAAAWSLQAARTALTARTVAEARQRGEALVAAGPISSPVYGSRHPVGGHADPVSGSLTLDRAPAGGESWVELLRRLDRKLGWLANAVYASPPGGRPLDRLIGAIPTLPPATARIVALHLADEDAWVRALPIAVTPSHRALPGVPCPACSSRALFVTAAGPVDGWTVVCRSIDCRPCVGPGCGCGMAGAVEGAPHIWPRASVIGAVAGAAPNTRTN